MGEVDSIYLGERLEKPSDPFLDLGGSVGESVAVLPGPPVVQTGPLTDPGLSCLPECLNLCLSGIQEIWRPRSP